MSAFRINLGLLIITTFLLSGLLNSGAQELESVSDHVLKQKTARLLNHPKAKFAVRLHPESLASLKYTNRKLHTALEGRKVVDGYPVIATIQLSDAQRLKLRNLLQERVENPQYGFNFSPRLSVSFRQNAEQQGYLLLDPDHKTARIVIGEQRSYVAISKKLAELIKKLCDTESKG